MHHQDYLSFIYDALHCIIYMQEYFATRRRYSLRRVCETQILKNTQTYRSGHNEAVLKTVCLTGTGVRIPQPAPKNTNFSVGVFLFFILNLCAVTMGRRAKTINNYFCEAETAQSNEPAESSLAQTIGGDYATVEGRQSQQSNEK